MRLVRTGCSHLRWIRWKDCFRDFKRIICHFKSLHRSTLDELYECHVSVRNAPVVLRVCLFRSSYSITKKSFCLDYSSWSIMSDSSLYNQKRESSERAAKSERGVPWYSILHCLDQVDNSDGIWRPARNNTPLPYSCRVSSDNQPEWWKPKTE